MANLNLIRDLCSEKNISLSQLCKKANISENGMQRLLRENSTKIDTLEKISKILEVDISYFFTGIKKNDDSNEIIKLKEQNEKNEKVINLYQKHLEIIQDDIKKKLSIINTGVTGIFKMMEEADKGNIKFKNDKELHEYIGRIRVEVQKLKDLE